MPEPTICTECGAELFWCDEITGAHPWGTGYSILVCNDCGQEYGRRYVGH